MDKLFIPKKIKVGYQQRSGTYNGRLAYVIYYDAKGKLRKEASWRGWCQIEDIYETKWVDGKGRVDTKKLQRKGLGSDEFDNVPTEGFVLNKGVGGQRESWSWNVRNEYIRVYDPRGFEFEISVANLLYILQECNSTKGKGLEGEFVYSWDGTELLLLPVGTFEYKASADFTTTQSKKIDRKDLIPGHKFQFKDLSEAIYIGHYTYNALVKKQRYYNVGSKQDKAHIFYDITRKAYFKTSGLTKIACKTDSDQPIDWAKLLIDWENKPLFSTIASFDWEDTTSATQFSSYYYNNSSQIFAKLKGTKEVFAIIFWGSNKADRSWDPANINTKIMQKNFRLEKGNIIHDDCEYDGPKFPGVNCNATEIRARFDILKPIVTLNDGTKLGYYDYLKKLELISK